MAATEGSDSFLAVEDQSFTCGTWTGAVANRSCNWLGRVPGNTCQVLRTHLKEFEREASPSTVKQRAYGRSGGNE